MYEAVGFNCRMKVLSTNCIHASNYFTSNSLKNRCIFLYLFGHHTAWYSVNVKPAVLRDSKDLAMAMTTIN